MKKEIFKNDLKSYLLVLVLGITAGLLVAFFSRFPSDDLWSFALFSSVSLGFWFFSSSLIALFSSKNYVAGINVAIYVYFMFYITGIFKYLTMVNKGYQTMSYFYKGLSENLFYGLIPAIVCFALAFVLWYGRKDKMPYKIIRYLPALMIFIELLNYSFKLFTVRQGLFMLIIDSLCFITYMIIISSKKRIKK